MPSITKAIDDRNQTVDILGFNRTASVRLAANVVSPVVSSGLHSSYRVVTIVADQPVWFEYANSAPSLANTTCQYLPANWLLDVKVKNIGDSGNTYFAFQAVTVAANVYVMPRS